MIKTDEGDHDDVDNWRKFNLVQWQSPTALGDEVQLRLVTKSYRIWRQSPILFGLQTTRSSEGQIIFRNIVWLCSATKSNCVPHPHCQIVLLGHRIYPSRSLLNKKSSTILYRNALRQLHSITNPHSIYLGLTGSVIQIVHIILFWPQLSTNYISSFSNFLPPIVLKNMLA